MDSVDEVYGNVREEMGVLFVNKFHMLKEGDYHFEIVRGNLSSPMLLPNVLLTEQSLSLRVLSCFSRECSVSVGDWLV